MPASRVRRALRRRDTRGLRAAQTPQARRAHRSRRRRRFPHCRKINGRFPAARSSATARVNAPGSTRCSESVGRMRSEPLPRPLTSNARRTQLCVADDAYPIKRPPSRVTPCSRTCGSSARVRATNTAIKFAADAPTVNTPLAPCGNPKSSAEPSQHRALDEYGAVIAAADIRVHRRCEQFGDDAGRRSRALHPAKETRMRVAAGIRQDRIDERAVHVTERRRLAEAAVRSGAPGPARASLATPDVRAASRDNRAHRRARHG